MKKLILILLIGIISVVAFVTTTSAVGGCSWWRQIFKKCAQWGACDCSLNNVNSNPNSPLYGQCVQQLYFVSWVWGTVEGGVYRLCIDPLTDPNYPDEDVLRRAMEKANSDVPKSNRAIMLKLQSMGMNVTEEDVARMRVIANRESPGCCD